MERGLRILASACIALFTLFFFLPFPKTILSDRKSYLCRWENGNVTSETLSAVLADFSCDADKILIERGGLKGRIEAGEEYQNIREILESGELADLLSLKADGLNDLEKSALFLTYRSRAYYSEELFRWNGERVVRSEESEFTELVLLSGDLPTGFLKQGKAEKLILHSYAEFTAKSLKGSEIKEVDAAEPYFTRGGAVYRRTAGGVRLVAALPYVEELNAECEFLDEGCLAACTCLKKLKLPEQYEGGLERLFSDSPMPDFVSPHKGEYEKIS